MIDALSAAEAGMMNDLVRMNSISNNLANSGTAGFKRELTSVRSFADQLAVASGASGASGPASIGRPQLATFTDQTSGVLKFTGNPLDLSLQGDGFFEVVTEQGAAYTRQGGFHVDESGRLVTTNGLAVMGKAGEIRLTGGQPVIDRHGKIWEGERLVGQLRVVKFSRTEDLIKMGAGLYAARAEASKEEDGQTQVRQGYVESSNVVLMEETVRMIETMRHFESSQRVIQSYDEMLDKAINVIGEL